MQAIVQRPAIQRLADRVGDIVLVKFGELRFKCVVLDVRVSYGTEQYKIMPVEGCGEVWKEALLCTPWEKKNTG